MAQDISTITDTQQPAMKSKARWSPSAPMVPPNTKRSYTVRRIPQEQLARVVPIDAPPQPGDVALAIVDRVGKNTSLELTTGRRCSLHLGDAVTVVFGNRYATRQFEGYARAAGDSCDLLSIGGLCGLVESKHANVAEPTKLKLVGAVADRDGQRLRLQRFALPRVALQSAPRVVVVCGSAMDSGKTYTAMSLIVGLRRTGAQIAGVKLTGTATGSDKWMLLDAGACVALDFVDGGYASTFLTPLNELLDLFDLLLYHASAAGASWVVVEIADGLLQGETAALLQSPRFTQRIGAWVYATGGPLAALGGVSLLRSWGIEPIAVSGLVTLSPLAIREVRSATGLSCLTAGEVQAGALNHAMRAVDAS